MPFLVEIKTLPNHEGLELPRQNVGAGIRL